MLHTLCAVPPPPTVTLAQPYGPTSATATASGAANVSWISWEFTATPASGIVSTQVADTPLVWWYNLKANTPCECSLCRLEWAGRAVWYSCSCHFSLQAGLTLVSTLTAPTTCKASPIPPHRNRPVCADTVSVVGITRSGKRVPGANTLAMRTPQEGAPTVAAATATSATQAIVRLTPPTNGQTVSLYIVSLCLKMQPTSCVRQNSPSIQLSFTGLTAGANYIVSATAKIGSTTVPASNTLPLAMPQRGAPILLTAVATTALTGAATAVAPSGVTFSKVS